MDRYLKKYIWRCASISSTYPRPSVRNVSRWIQLIAIKLLFFFPWKDFAPKSLRQDSIYASTDTRDCPFRIIGSSCTTPLVFYPVGMFVWSVWSSGHNWPNLPFAYLSALSSASLDGFSVLFAFVCFASENKRNSVTPGWQLSNCVHLWKHFYSLGVGVKNTKF